MRNSRIVSTLVALILAFGLVGLVQAPAQAAKPKHDLSGVVPGKTPKGDLFIGGKIPTAAGKTLKIERKLKGKGYDLQEDQDHRQGQVQGHRRRSGRRLLQADRPQDQGLQGHQGRRGLHRPHVTPRLVVGLVLAASFVTSPAPAADGWAPPKAPPRPDGRRPRRSATTPRKSSSSTAGCPTYLGQDLRIERKVNKAPFAAWSTERTSTDKGRFSIKVYGGKRGSTICYRVVVPSTPEYRPPRVTDGASRPRRGRPVSDPAARDATRVPDVARSLVRDGHLV